jgi:hypothetical protein
MRTDKTLAVLGLALEALSSGADRDRVIGLVAHALDEPETTVRKVLDCEVPDVSGNPVEPKDRAASPAQPICHVCDCVDCRRIKDKRR